MYLDEQYFLIRNDISFSDFINILSGVKSVRDMDIVQVGGYDFCFGWCSLAHIVHLTITSSL